MKKRQTELYNKAQLLLDKYYKEIFCDDKDCDHCKYEEECILLYDIQDYLKRGI